jgi:hypothetical protein
MRTAAAAIVSALALAACNQSAPAGGGAEGPASMFPELGAAAYRAEGQIMRDGQSLPVVMIRDGAKMRMEVATPGGQSVIITNGETGESLIIATAAGRTYAMRATGDQFEDPAQDWRGELAASATRTGACSLAGESGSEWTRTEASGASTACVTNDGIILLAQKNGQVVWQTTSVQRGPQNADLFKLPPGVQVMDLNNIPGLGAAIERARGGAGQ